MVKGGGKPEKAIGPLVILNTVYEKLSCYIESLTYAGHNEVCKDDIIYTFILLRKVEIVKFIGNRRITLCLHEPDTIVLPKTSTFITEL